MSPKSEKLNLELGSLARSMAILVGSLHDAGLIDGNAIAASIRLDEHSDEEFRIALADLIRRVIEKLDVETAFGPREV